MCVFIKMATEVEIQVTQCGPAQKFINIFELLVLATINLSTNM